MIDPIKKPEAPNEWHYPACMINAYSSRNDICPKRMYDQIQQLKLEYEILARANRRLQTELDKTK
jgi:hypothetical protein